MKKLVYYVASSLDGFIAGANDDVTGFIYEGKAVEQYLSDLKSFQTVIMGRKTYEFGYQFGVKPGDPSPTYAHMKHYIFSDHLKFDRSHDLVEVKKLIPEEIDAIKARSATDVYLCGGGNFAGWLLEHKKIDILKVKINPCLLNDGVKLFEGVHRQYRLQLLKNESFIEGIQFLTYQIIY